MSAGPSPRRILVVRSAIESFYEPAWVRALRENGHQVALFDTFARLTRVPPSQGEEARGEALRSPDRLGWWQHRLLWGPRIAAVNRELVEVVRTTAPDVVLMYLGHHYTAETIGRLRDLSFVALFHSDDPFGPRRRHPRYRLLRAALPRYDGGHFYRPATTADAQAAGLTRADTLLDFYQPWSDYPRGGALVHEASFIGHFEPDGRQECVIRAVHAGLPMRVYSNDPTWRRHVSWDIAQVLGPSPGLYGDDYRAKLSTAKISVCFLSHWNRDVYTRRVFEIPACRGFLLCERTDFMQTLYEEGREAAYFGSPDEMVDKIRYYLSHEAEREAIAAAGHARLRSAGHDIHTRLRGWASTVARWREETGKPQRA